MPSSTAISPLWPRSAGSGSSSTWRSRLPCRAPSSKEQFIEEFSARFAALEAEKIEWSSIQVEDNIAVQSLNLILKKRFSGVRIAYKLILFMSADPAHEAKEKEWKLHYLRGLRI